MQLEVMLDKKNGRVWDISEIVADLQWQTARIGKAGTLSFTLIDNNRFYGDKSFAIRNGDIIQVRKDQTNVFYGYVFEIGYGAGEEIRIKAYDQIRYLMANDTYVFTGKTATEIIQKIATDSGLKLGKLADTKYKIPSLVADGQKLLDTMCKALDYTLINGYGNFYLYDDFGGLTLANVSQPLTDFYFGDESLMTDYDYAVSIDSDTYNRIKIVQDNKSTNRRDVYLAQDSANMAKWGRLQLYQTADEGMNSAQISQMLETLITLKNRESKSLRIEAIGDIRVRAGSYVRIFIERLGINQPMLVDECNHKFDGDHTMSLTLKVIS
ncbi:XkdQ/YqbQ family protein [Cohnella thailandensis]|uniref:YqbQ/XkdQ domain-containing protein n=1 Tax=Cohnella thailandensis TaxID=557557 RepID=A0A841SNP9_9BACL|nr:hypothetical protein [Cohnella thailandensis]MBB6633564.1 hypothetical protein [Cohnella thailandensis]MBP1974582.1 hypothetical protein [Cohnella thailandensis]